jgi:hypothetical protein
MHVVCTFVSFKELGCKIVNLAPPYRRQIVYAIFGINQYLRKIRIAGYRNSGLIGFVLKRLKRLERFVCIALLFFLI